MKGIHICFMYKTYIMPPSLTYEKVQVTNQYSSGNVYLTNGGLFIHPAPQHSSRPSQERHSSLVGTYVKILENKHSFRYIILKVCIINEEEMCNLEVRRVLKWRFIEDGHLTMSACHFGLACGETWIWRHYLSILLTFEWSSTQVKQGYIFREVLNKLGLERIYTFQMIYKVACYIQNQNFKVSHLW